jgi:hypothetical protein
MLAPLACLAVLVGYRRDARSSFVLWNLKNANILNSLNSFEISWNVSIAFLNYCYGKTNNLIKTELAPADSTQQRCCERKRKRKRGRHVVAAAAAELWRVA